MDFPSWPCCFSPHNSCMRVTHLPSSIMSKVKPLFFFMSLWFWSTLLPLCTSLSHCCYCFVPPWPLFLKLFACYTVNVTTVQQAALPQSSPLRQCLLCMPFTCTTRQCLTLSACLPVSLAFSLPFPRPNITGNSLHSMLLPFPNRYHHHVCPFLVLYSQKIESLAEELDITKQWCRLDRGKMERQLLRCHVHTQGEKGWQKQSNDTLYGEVQLCQMSNSFSQEKYDTDPPKVKSSTLQKEAKLNSNKSHCNFCTHLIVMDIGQRSK